MRLVMILMVLTLSACHSGWDKDPLKGEDDRIKNAVPPETTLGKIPPPKQSSLFLDMPYVYTVREGATLEIVIKPEISHKEVTLAAIRIPDLQDKFPGARFDEATKTIYITPDFDFVPVEAPNVIQNINLSFDTAYEGTILTVKRPLTIHVVPQNAEIPEIVEVSFQGKRGDVITGERKMVTVRVKDTEQEYSPRLRVFDSYKTSTVGSQFVDVSKEGVYNPARDEWEFELAIDVPTDFYLSGQGRRVALDLVVYSISGVPSRSYPVNYAIYSRAKEPVVVAERLVQFTEGQESDYTFSVYDPLDRGEVDATCSKKPASMDCVCRTTKKNGQRVAYCTLTWAPAASGNAKVEIIGTNTVRRGPAQSQATMTHEMNILVRSAP